MRAAEANGNVDTTLELVVEADVIAEKAAVAVILVIDGDVDEDVAAAAAVDLVAFVSGEVELAPEK